jgi:hypothetical protein
MARPVNRLFRLIELVRERNRMSGLYDRNLEIISMMRRLTDDLATGAIKQEEYNNIFQDLNTEFQNNLEQARRLSEHLMQEQQQVMEEAQQNAQRRAAVPVAVPVANTGCAAGTGCTVMGGSRRRLRKTKKHRKHRK